MTRADLELAVGGLVLVALLVAGFVLVSATGHDPTAYVVFISGPVVSSLVGFVITHRVARVEAITKDVKHQTNTLLTNRLDSLDTQLAAAADDRTAHDHTTP